jgi:hypothetical protein
MWIVEAVFGAAFLLSAYRLAGNSENETFWKAVLAGSIVGVLAIKVLDPAEGDCLVEWDGRANPTVCE